MGVRRIRLPKTKTEWAMFLATVVLPGGAAVGLLYVLYKGLRGRKWS